MILSDWGFIIAAAMTSFVLSVVFALRLIRSLFDWFGLGPR